MKLQYKISRKNLFIIKQDYLHNPASLRRSHLMTSGCVLFLLRDGGMVGMVGMMTGSGSGSFITLNRYIAGIR